MFLITVRAGGRARWVGRDPGGGSGPQSAGKLIIDNRNENHTD